MKVTLTTWSYYLVVLSAILALVTGQCTKDNARVEFLEDNEILTDSPPRLSRTVGDSFVIGCRRCDASRGAPNWFYSNRTEISSCNISSSSICAEYDANDELIRYLHFTSVTRSLAGTYRCTRNQRIIIRINEPAVATSVMFNQSSYSIDEDEGSVQIMLILNSSIANDITIQVTSSDDDSATGGSDYTAGPYPVMIPAGETSGSYEISIVVDSMSESDELFHLTIDTNTLPDGITLGNPDSATVTIRNDDITIIGFQHPSYIVREGDQLVQPVIILSNPMSTDLVINIRDKNGTATDGVDYSPGPYSVTLHADMTRISFDISITDDNVPEPDETFRLAINSRPLPNYIKFGTKGSTVTIINDDSNGITLKFNQRVYSINESDGIVQPMLILSGPLTTDLTLQVMTIDSSATIDDNDYHPGPYNVTLAAGQTNASFDVIINDDDVLENDENFTLIFNVPSMFDVEVLGTDNQLTVSILNDDSSIVKFNQPAYSVSEDDELVRPELVLSNPSSTEITVQVNDDAITATGGDDYNSGPYIVKFPVGMITASFNVSITKDNISEGNENFHLMINSSALPNGVIVDATSDTSVTIVNDDGVQVQTEGNSGGSNGATGAVVGVIVVLLVMIALIVIIIILLLLYYKRRSKHSRLSKAEHTDNGIELNGGALKAVNNDEPFPPVMSGVLLKVPPKGKDTVAKEVTTSVGQPTTLIVELPYSDHSEITWKKDGELVNHQMLSDGSLYITDTGISDQGDYTVTTTGTEDSSPEIIRLTVINPQLPTCMSKHLPIKVEDFPEHVAMMQSDDSIRFEREYENITVDVPFSQHAAKLYVNGLKNRYKNIIPHDHSRVVLTQLDHKTGRDYINASFIDGYKEARAYIAAQGPLSNTVEDFWRMIWEHDVATIVMVTRLVESAKVKCHQYWPNGDSKVYGDFKVTIRKEETIAKYSIRTFTIEKVSTETSEIREVYHFHYMAWPDHGVPKYGTDLLEFQKRIDKHHKRNNGTPMLVHCSAGVGRSGTFIAIDIEMQRIKHENIVDVYNCVCKLRFCRDLMVQSEAQYELIHTALLEYITCGDTSITAPTENVRDKINQLSTVDPSTKKTGFELQFEKLTKASPKEKEFTYWDATSSLNRKKNRSKKFIPPDNARARLSQTDDESDYVNASYIDGYRHCKAFLVGPGPMESTVSDFWRMIWEKQSFAIVMLGQLVENGEEASYKYWPSKDNEMQFRNFVIETTSEDSVDKNVTKRVIKITHKQTNASKTITQLQYVEWSPKSCPGSPTSVVDLLEILERVQRKTSNGPITIHCSDGIGRSGTFCTLMISINRFKAEQMTDIFQTINTIRTQKPRVVANVEQYKFIHEALIAMLQRYSNYANFTLENSL